jgi:hypothetical protein
MIHYYFRLLTDIKGKIGFYLKRMTKLAIFMSMNAAPAILLIVAAELEEYLTKSFLR